MELWPTDDKEKGENTARLRDDDPLSQEGRPTTPGMIFIYNLKLVKYKFH